jgi:GH24 family phage-related lysozyme (muramidase)
MLDKVKALTAAPDVSDKMQNAYNATGAATKAITSAMTSPVVTNLMTALGNTPAVAAARDKAQSAASNAGTNAIRGLASDLSYNVGTGMFRNTPIKLMANASPAMAAAHAAFNAYNPGLPRLSTEELKKRIAQRSLSSIQDEFTGMLPWSRK